MPLETLLPSVARTAAQALLDSYALPSPVANTATGLVYMLKVVRYGIRGEVGENGKHVFFPLGEVRPPLGELLEDTDEEEIEPTGIQINVNYCAFGFFAEVVPAVHPGYECTTIETRQVGSVTFYSCDVYHLVPGTDETDPGREYVKTLTASTDTNQPNPGPPPGSYTTEAGLLKFHIQGDTGVWWEPPEPANACDIAILKGTADIPVFGDPVFEWPPGSNTITGWTSTGWRYDSAGFDTNPGYGGAHCICLAAVPGVGQQIGPIKTWLVQRHPMTGGVLEVIEDGCSPPDVDDPQPEGNPLTWQLLLVVVAVVLAIIAALLAIYVAVIVVTEIVIPASVNGLQGTLAAAVNNVRSQIPGATSAQEEVIVAAEAAANEEGTAYGYLQTLKEQQAAGIPVTSEQLGLAEDRYNAAYNALEQAQQVYLNRGN